ncbi:GFA family protein [Vibrio sp. CDRSL-10 TSBA]
MQFPIHASCQCGQVTYQLHAAPMKVMACHCKECQKLSTAPYSITALVAAKDIEFNGEMTEWGRIAESGNHNLGFSCVRCSNRIYHLNPAQPEVIKLKLRPVDLEDDRLFEPTAHVWVSEKMSWLTLPSGVAVFDKQS